MSAPLLAASATTRSDPDFLINKTYDLKEDVEASTWVVTLFKLKTNVERAKKFTGLIGLAGTSFMALKIAIVAGATLALPFPPLVIGVALLAATVALGIILYKLSLPKEVEEFQKVAQKFAKPNTPSEDLLPKVFVVNGARQGWFPKKVYAIKKIAKGAINTLTLMRTINPGLFKKPKLKMLRESINSKPIPIQRAIEKAAQRAIEKAASFRQIALSKTFLNEKQEKTPLANGGDLYRFKSDLTPAQKVQIAVIILKKMVAFWQLGYVHRDIKDENFLIHDGAPYLADFDFAQIYQKKQSGIIDKGTPVFILNTNKKVDFLHADFYALGMMIADLTGNILESKVLGTSTEKDRNGNFVKIGFFHNDVKTAYPTIPFNKLLPKTDQSKKLIEITRKLVTEPEKLNLSELENMVRELQN